MIIKNTPSDELHIYNNSNEEIVAINETGIVKGIPQTKHTAPKQVDKNNQWLFEVDYDDIDYDLAAKYFKKTEITAGKCSSCRKGNFYGRNFDWGYNNEADFLIRVKGNNDRYSSIGMGFMHNFSYEDVIENRHPENYDILPFATIDGINEKGLFCNTNVVPIIDNPRPTTKTGKDGQMELSVVMVCRYILDHFDNAETAVDFLQNGCRIVANEYFSKTHYETHWFIGDVNSDTNYVVEILNNQVFVTPSNIMTNFYEAGMKTNDDGSLYSIVDNIVGEECKAIKENKLRKYSTGIERYNILNAGLNDVETAEDMTNLMKSVKYTNAYDTSLGDEFWYSEFTGDANGIDVTLEWTKDMFGPYMPIIEEKFAQRSREIGDTWQTTHTCVYDLKNLQVILYSQEDYNKQYAFSLKTVDVPDLPGDADDGEYILVAKKQGDFVTYEWQSK